MNDLGARSLLIVIAVAVLGGATGCRAFDLVGTVSGNVIGTTAQVGGDAVGAAASALSLRPRGVVRHTRDAARHTIQGAEAVTTNVIRSTVDLATDVF